MLYTDGVTEAMNKRNEEYGMDRFSRIIQSNSNLSPRELCDRVMDDIGQFCDKESQYDDITLIAIRARPEAFRGSDRSGGKVVEMG